MLDDVEGPEQTTLVRVLIVLAIGIPVLIEVVTFGGLVGHYVAGGGGDGAAATPTRTAEGAGEGDEILPGTEATERLAEASVVTGDDGWRVRLTVAVSEVPGPYELRLGAVTTREGRTVAGDGATTGELAAGESGSVTGTWLLPQGQRPRSVTVTVVADGDSEPYTVELGDVPVSN